MNSLRITPFATLAAMAIAALSLMAACGGDDDDSSATPTATVTAGADLDAATVAQLRELGQKWGQAETKITYEYSSAVGSYALEANLVIYRRAPDFRRDIIKPDATTIAIERADSGYTCIASPAGGQCAALPLSDAAAAYVIPFLTDLGKEDGLSKILSGVTALEAVPARNIIGKAASCFAASGTLGEALAGEATWCFSEDGLLLAQSFSGGSQSFELNATTIERPKDADFEPPYEVVTQSPTSPTPSP